MSEDVKLNRHTAADAAAIDMSGALKNRPILKLPLTPYLTIFQANHATFIIDDVLYTYVMHVTPTSVAVVDVLHVVS